MSVADQLTADLKGSSAVPRKNGELVFNEPWESRAFGMAVALCEQGFFHWEEFRARLIVEIAAWEREHRSDSRPATVDRSGDPNYKYYERWLGALEKLLLDKQLCSKKEIDSQAAAIEREHAD
jgi:nitrile hydratase accessory protein